MKLLLTSLISCFFLSWNYSAFSQPNCGSYNGPMITALASWDWAVPTNDPNYCATWAAQFPRTQSTTVVNAPWYSPANGTLNQIYLDQDYTKAKGWVLLRMDMGGRVPRDIPYFILYNKYRGIIRAFFYLDNSSGTYTKGVNITLSHSSSNASHSSGILALSQLQVQSQDFYLQNRANNDELITYVPQFTSQRGWVVGDFQAGFDSYAGNSQYSSSSLQFSVYGVTTSTIALDGSINFKTDQQVQEGGYAVSGKSSDKQGNGARTFLADGQKVLSAVGAVDVTKFFDAFQKKADLTAATVNSTVTKSQFTGLSNKVASQNKAANTLKNITGVASSLGSVFGLIGTVVGLIWPDDSPSAPAVTPFYPTVSNGSLSLKGSISTTVPQTSITMQVPGTQHYFPGTQQQTDGGNQPYYDCPLGIFNIKNTPILNKFTFNAIDGHESGCPDDAPPECGAVYRKYDSYQVTNDIVAIYNDAAGLKLLSVQAAIVAETPTDVYNYSNQYYSSYNPLLERTYSGEAEVLSADANKVVYATPFIDLGNFKNQALNTAADSKVYVRIKAVLARKDATAGSPPIYFVQDYAIQPNSTTTATNPRYTGDPDSTEPPFSNLASALIFVPNPPGTSYQNPYTLTNPYLVPASNYTSPLVLSVPTTISAGATSLNPSSGNVTINHPSTSNSSLFLSNTSIALGAGFSVVTGTNFVATTPLQGYKQGGQAMIETFSGPCSYNSSSEYNPVAYRIATRKDTTSSKREAKEYGLVISPNPTNGIILVNTTLDKNSDGIIIISNYLGQEIEHTVKVSGGQNTQQLSLTGRASGLYFIRLITNGKTYTQKILLE